MSRFLSLAAAVCFLTLTAPTGAGGDDQLAAVDPGSSGNLNPTAGDLSSDLTPTEVKPIDPSEGGNGIGTPRFTNGIRPGITSDRQLHFTDVVVDVPCDKVDPVTGRKPASRQDCTFGLDQCEGDKGAKSRIIAKLKENIEMKIKYMYQGINVDWRQTTNPERPIGKPISGDLQGGVVQSVCNLSKPGESPRSSCASDNTNLMQISNDGLVMDLDRGVGSKEFAIHNGARVDAMRCHLDQVTRELREGKLRVSPQNKAMARQIMTFYKRPGQKGEGASKVQLDKVYDSAIGQWVTPRNPVGFFNQCDTKDMNETKQAEIFKLCGEIDPMAPDAAAMAEKTMEKNGMDVDVRQSFMSACYTRMAGMSLTYMMGYLAIAEVYARAGTHYDNVMFSNPGTHDSPYAQWWAHTAEPKIEKETKDILRNRVCTSGRRSKRKRCAESNKGRVATSIYRDANKPNGYERQFAEFQKQHFGEGKCRQ
ncbi:MAG: hypothetical protein AB7P04_04700 [Bacteriovoracia bacterium]